MAKRLDITDEERRQASRNIKHFFMFTDDVLVDPSILDQMPDKSCVEPIPFEEREPGRRYDVETARMVVTVTPVGPEELAQRKPAQGG